MKRTLSRDTQGTPVTAAARAHRRACLSMVVAGVLLFVAPWHANAFDSIVPADAAKHVGETATVCGTVASTRYANRSRGQLTFLNLDRPYPNQVFTALIWGSDRQAFGAPETRYANRRICVTGPIQSYHGAAEIVVRNPGQITQ